MASLLNEEDTHIPKEAVGKRRVGVWEMEAFTVKLFISIALVGVLGLFFRLYNALVVKPKKLRSILRNQGISGPPPSFLLGNIREIKESQSTAVKDSCTDTHNCAAALFPFFEKWRNKYGRIQISSFFIIHPSSPLSHKVNYR